jgi:hypothetical protein
MPGVRRQLVEEQRYWLDIGDSQFSRITVDANLSLPSISTSLRTIRSKGTSRQ